jgi:hypothetical protein
MAQEDGTKEAYERVCESYHAIDDFRMKLLGLLPVATGTGVFLLLNSNTDLLGPGGQGSRQHTLEVFVTAAGLIGLMFTLGLFAYELFGIKRCHYLIEAGTSLEIILNVRGQFRNRPRELMGFINEPFAAALIYPASMAAWVFLAVAYRSGVWRWVWPIAAFLFGMSVTLGAATGIKRKGQQRLLRQVRDEVNPHPTMTVAQISQSINVEEDRIRQVLARLVSPGPDALGGWFKRHKRKPEAVRADDSVDVALSNMKTDWLPVRDGDQIIGTFGGADWAGTVHKKKVKDILETAASM